MALSSASFEYVRTVLRQRSGQYLEDDKVYLVETRLLPLARRHGFESVEALVLRLRGHSNERLLGELVEAMTINETFFSATATPSRSCGRRCFRSWCGGGRRSAA
jgi:chemotaxis protein methyltransferase CheR